MLAIEKGHEGRLKQLIDARANLNQKGSVSVFQCACLHPRVRPFSHAWVFLNLRVLILHTGWDNSGHVSD